MTGDPRQRRLSDALRGYRQPPPTPRERMWRRIDAARDEIRPRTERPWWRRRQLVWPAAVAAALAAGILIGRFPGALEPQGQPPAATPTLAHDGSAPDDTTRAVLGAPGYGMYRRAARPLLARSETLLLQVRTGGIHEHPLYSGRAADLLAQTRLLLGSPAGRDPQLAPLLGDVELALARLVQMAGTSKAHDDRRALEEGLARNSVLPRIRDQLTTSSPSAGL